MRAHKKLILSFLIAAVLIFSHAHAQHPKPSEYEVKAAFIYNFAKFVEWPADIDKTVTLCILGDSPFGAAIEAIHGKPVGEKNMAVTRVKSDQQLKDCQILFISNSEKTRISQVLKNIGNSNVLTIGDTEGFGHQGVIINFYIEQDKVRFEINLESSIRANLKISSKLIKLGKLIE